MSWKGIYTYLGNGDAGSRRLANFADLAATTSDDAANHISRDANILRLDFLSILVMSGGPAAGCVGIRSTIERPRAAAIAEVSPVTCAHNTGAAVFASPAAAAAEAARPGLSAYNRVVENGTGPTLPVINQTLANLPHSALDTLWRTLNLDNSLGGLGEHFLLGDHAHARNILYMLDFETLSANDCAHLVVGNEEFDSFAEVSVACTCVLINTSH